MPVLPGLNATVGRPNRLWPDDVVALPDPTADTFVSELVVSGADARALVSTVPIEAPWLYVRDGQFFVVRVAPVIPLLSQP